MLWAMAGRGRGRGKGKGEGNKGNQGADRMHRRDGTTKEHRHKQAGRLAACGWMDGDGQMGRREHRMNNIRPEGE